MKVKLLSRVLLLATPWTATYQAPSSMGFSRQECWSGVPLPSPAIRVCRLQIVLSNHSRTQLVSGSTRIIFHYLTFATFLPSGLSVTTSDHPVISRFVSVSWCLKLFTGMCK